MSHEKKDVYALFTHALPKNGSDYGHIRLTFVYLSDETGKPRNFDTYSDTIAAQGFDLADLTLETFYNAADDKIHLYAGELTYQDVYSIDARRAKSMAHTLDKVQRKLDKYNEEFGFVSSFADYAIRVMRALGVKSVVKVSKDSRGGWNFYDSDEYITLPVADVRYTIQSALDDVCKRYNKPLE